MEGTKEGRTRSEESRMEKDLRDKRERRRGGEERAWEYVRNAIRTAINS